MKKVISLLLTVMMLFSISIVCTSAYTLPEGFAVSSDEGTAFDAVDGTAIGYMGDADNSSDVSIKDATAIQKHIAKLETLEGNALTLGDVDFSTDITIKDATAIQKWIAKIAVDEPVYHLLYQGEAQPALSVVGSWQTNTDLADEINASLPLFTDDQLLIEHVSISTFPATIIYTFDEEGKVTVSYSESMMEQSIAQVKKELEGDMYNYLAAYLAQNGIDISVEAFLSFMKYNSITEFVDAMFPMDMVSSLTTPVTGTYRVEDNKLYLTADNAEDNGYYETFTLVDGVLTFTSNSNGIGQDSYPVVFYAVK